MSALKEKLINFVDSTVEAVAPKHAYNRKLARAKLKVLPHAQQIQAAAYHASQRSRKTAYWDVSSQSPNEENNEHTLSDLRDKSGDLYRNNPIAKAAIDRQAINVVGPGLQPRAKIDAKSLGLKKEEARELEKTAMREWKLFSRRCDIERRRTMNGIQYLTYISSMTRGDVFVSTPMFKYPGDVYSLKIQVIEADRVCNPDYQNDTDKLKNGIELGSNGEQVAYHVLDRHPSEVFKGKWKRLQVFADGTGNRRVMQLSASLNRPQQQRSAPILTPIMLPLKKLGKYRDSEISAAVTGAAFTVFVKTLDDAAKHGLSGTAPGQDFIGQVDPNSLPGEELHIEDDLCTFLRPNQDIKIADPSRPNVAYEPFTLSIYKEIGAGLNIPLEELLQYYQSSFSAARASIVQAWKLYLWRRHWMAENLLDHIWSLFWDEMVALGRINVDGYDDPARRLCYTGVKWIGPVRGAIDENKAVDAAAKRVANLLSDADNEIIELTGRDPDEVHEALVEQKERRIRDGLDEPIGAPEARDEVTTFDEETS